MVQSSGKKPSFWAEVALGFLQAIGLLPLKTPYLPRGSYWAKRPGCPPELRVPASRIDEPPPF